MARKSALLPFLILLAVGFCACRPPAGQSDIRLGVAASQNDLWDEAIAHWTKVPASEPSAAAAHNNLAVAYEKKGLREAARKEYESALSLAPADPAIEDNFRRFTKSRAMPGSGPAAGRRPAQKITIDIPAISPAGMERYREFVVTEFAEAAPVPDLKLGRTFSEYLETELRRVFKGTVSRMDLTAYQKDTPGVLRDAVILAGTVGLVREPQKALRHPGALVDGPFNLENRVFAERTRFVLTFGYRLVDAATGRAIVNGDFKETRIFAGVEQTPEFALFDFLPAIKAKLVAAMFGKRSLEERYLLLR